VGRASRVGRRPLPRRRPKRDLRLPKAAKPESGAPREGSKTGAVLELLRRKNGASLKEIMKETGWLPHSVRGFLSGTVGKKMGLEVISTKSADGERTYSIKG